MPQPTYQQVHPVDIPLTNLSIAYTPENFIADQVFPNVPVQYLSGRYFTYTKADWLRRDVAVRAYGTRAARAGYNLSTSAYQCVEQALATGVPDEIVANALDPVQPLSDATRYVTTQIYLQVESDVSGKVFGTGSWSGSSTPATLWSNDASNPPVDVQTAASGIASSIGRLPSIGVLGYPVWNTLLNNAEFLDRVKFGAAPGNPAVVTLQAAGALFQLAKVLVGLQIEDTAAEGVTSTLSFLWGNHMFVGYVAPNPSLLTPSAGYIFTYLQRQIANFREEQERQQIVECRQSWVTALTATDAGYLLKSVI